MSPQKRLAPKDRNKTSHRRRTTVIGFVVALAGTVWVGGLTGCHKDNEADSPAPIGQPTATDRLVRPAPPSTTERKVVGSMMTRSAESPATARQSQPTEPVVQPAAPSAPKPGVIQPSMTPSAECPRPAFPQAVKPDALWPLVAQSELIVAGTLDVPVARIRDYLASGQYDYIQFSIRVDEVLKGHANGTVAVTYYVKPVPYRPSPETLVQTHGKQALLFLTQGDRSLAGNWYFAGYQPGALRPAGPELLEQVRNEVTTQAEVLRDFSRLFPPEEQPLYQEVKRLIDATTSKDTQRQAFEKLEELGSPAVPAIILLMDDRRDLGEHSISLRNRSPNAFEELRHYGPKVVVDALAAILNQVTGRDFGTIHNGGSEQQRQDAVNGWRIYLYYLRRGDTFRQTEMTPTIPRP